MKTPRRTAHHPATASTSTPIDTSTLPGIVDYLEMYVEKEKMKKAAKRLSLVNGDLAYQERRSGSRLGLPHSRS